MNSSSIHLKKIQVDVKALRVGERYNFRSKKDAYIKYPTFSATVESYSVTRTSRNIPTSRNMVYIVLKDRYQLTPYRPMTGTLSTPASWIKASTLDIPCLPGEIGRLIQQY